MQQTKRPKVKSEIINPPKVIPNKPKKKKTKETIANPPIIITGTN
jgi:hypothetical protein